MDCAHSVGVVCNLLERHICCTVKAQLSEAIRRAMSNCCGDSVGAVGWQGTQTVPLHVLKLQGVETTKTVDVDRGCLSVDMMCSKFTEYRALECCLTCWRAFRSATDSNTVTDLKDNLCPF